MMDYARHDTHYLKPLSDRLRSELEAKGRLSWHQESCARLIQDCSQGRPPDPDQIWRVKGSHKLNRAALAVLREVWHWREIEAIGANRPPFFILQHDALVAVSAAAVAGQPVAPLLPRNFHERRRNALQKAITTGLALPPGEHPQHIQTTSRRLSDAVKRRTVELQKHRDARAADLGLDPTLIASRATLLDLAEDWPQASLKLMNWQRDLLK